MGSMGGQVTPAAQGDSGTVVNIVNYTGAPVQERRTSNGTGREVVDVIIGEVSANIARGGAIARTLQSTYSGLNRRGVLRS